MIHSVFETFMSDAIELSLKMRRIQLSMNILDIDVKRAGGINGR